MSNIVTVRDPEVIAAEINTIKRQVRESAILASIQIGGKLVEAKGMLEHGQWQKWLEENVEYSQSTANYLMQLYNEYGTGQQDLFDTWTSSEAFGKLSYSQHIALLSLPFGERASFVQETGAEEMSARQLQAAIRERQEAQKARETAEQLLQTEQESRKKLMDQLQKEQASAKEAEKAREKALMELEQARQETARLRQEQENREENPQIPEELMEKLRREAEEAAAKEAEETARKKVQTADEAAAAATKRAQELQKEVERLQSGEAGLRQEVENLRKQARMGNPDVAVFQTLYIGLQEDWNRIMGAWKKVALEDGEAAESCRKALQAALQKFRWDMGEGGNENG